MTRVSPTLLRLAAANNAMASPLAAHQRTAISTRSFHELLTPDELCFLDDISNLSTITPIQGDALNVLASKVERGRV